MLSKCKYNNSFCGWNTAIAVLLAAFAAAPVAAEDNVDALWTALTSGTPDMLLRLRYEHVEEDIPTLRKDANALTARVLLGYRTGLFYNIGAYLQMEAVGAALDDYNDGGSQNAEGYAVVADPEGVELQQGYLSYQYDGGYDYDKFSVKLGRQLITYRDAPFHRFIGPVVWRQNQQTHDAFTLLWEPLDDLKLQYAYSWKVNRVFGEDAVPNSRSEFDSKTNLINVQYTGLPYVKLEAYTYLLDFYNGPVPHLNSSDTFGIRANGVYPLNDQWGVLYTAEYAYQEDAASNPINYEDNYYLGELGLKTKFEHPSIKPYIKTLMAKFSYEKLGGDHGLGSFKTPLATGHAFQGWADRFLVTPTTGVEDFYVTAVAGLPWKMKAIFSYHNLNSDAGDFDYGDEYDVLISKKFRKHYTLAAKAAFYDADHNSNNPRGTGIGEDVTKVWAWFQASF